MKKPSDGVVVTIGNFFDFLLNSRQSESMKAMIWPQAMEAYRKGYLHLIPSSSTEQGKIQQLPLVFAEPKDSGDFLECTISRNQPQKPLSKEEFLRKYFPTEQAFSWVFVSEEDRPALPVFVIGANIENTVYRICEFKDKHEALQFVETTAIGLKNCAAKLFNDIPWALPFLADLSEFQTVDDTHVLLFRLPGRGALSHSSTPEQLSFSYIMWWSQENIVFYVAPPVVRFPANERQRVLSGSIEKDLEYQKGHALLNVYRKYLSILDRLREKPALTETTIQSFDHWIWNQKGTTPPLALGRRTISIFPTSLAGNELNEFHMIQINVERKGFIGAFRSSTPPKSAYAKMWKNTKKGEGWLRHLVAINSKLPETNDRLKILLDAFENGPPIVYVSAHYGSNIAASMLFFNKDLQGPKGMLEEACRDDEWKSFFFNTLLQAARERYYILTGIEPFVTVIENVPDTPLGRTYGTFEMIVSSGEAEAESIWVWPDECGFCFLGAVGAGSQSVRNEFLQQLTVEEEKAVRVISEKSEEKRKEAIEALGNKIDYFLAKIPK